MALTAQVPSSINPTGTTGTAVKPITDGQEVTVVADQGNGFGFWDALDSVGTSTINGISKIVEAAAQVKVNELMPGPSATDAGTPGNNPGDQQAKASGGLGSYALPLMIGGGLVAAFLIYKAVD